MILKPPPPMRSTTGVCFGMRGKLASAIVVLSCRRDDPTRRLFVRHEWERAELDFDAMAAELKKIRELYRPALAIGYLGGRDDEKVFKTLSIRLGQNIDPAPGDAVAPTQFLVTDFRSGRLKAKPDSLVVRDVQLAIWRDGTPDQTGIIAALRCADWAQQQYRQKPALKATEKNAAILRDRNRRMSRPF